MAEGVERQDGTPRRKVRARSGRTRKEKRRALVVGRYLVRRIRKRPRRAVWFVGSVEWCARGVLDSAVATVNEEDGRLLGELEWRGRPGEKTE